MKSITCTQCGFVSWAAPEGRCKSCGQFLTAAQPAYQQAPAGSWGPQGSQGSWEQQQHDQASWDQQGAQGSWEQQGAQDSWGQHDQQGQWGPQEQQGHWEQQGAPYYSYGAPTKKSQGMATASLVIGVIGIFTFGLLAVGAIIGLILGVVALKRTSRQPSVYGGRGVAIGGIVTNALGVLTIFPLAIVLAIAVPNLLAARRAANEASAINGLREIIAAESTYASTAGAGSFGTLAELGQSNLLDKSLAGGFRNGYRFRVVAFDGGCEARAMPLTYGQTGFRSFYASCDGSDVRGADKNGGPAEETDPLLGSPSFGVPDEFYDPSLRTAPPNPRLIPQR
jgi:type II secretory pathway pseudopilin PulG